MSLSMKIILSGVPESRQLNSTAHFALQSFGVKQYYKNVDLPPAPHVTLISVSHSQSLYVNDALPPRNVYLLPEHIVSHIDTQILNYSFH